MNIYAFSQTCSKIICNKSKYLKPHSCEEIICINNYYLNWLQEIIIIRYSKLYNCLKIIGIR